MENRIFRLFLIAVVLCSFTFSVYSADYTFTVTERMIQKFVKKYEKSFKENSLHSFELSFTSDNRIKITTNYKHIIPTKIYMKLYSVEPNVFSLKIDEFKVVGFIPAPKKTLCNKIKGAVEAALSEKDEEDGAKDGESNSDLLKMNVDEDKVLFRLKNPAVRAFEGLKITRLRQRGKEIQMLGEVEFSAPDTDFYDDNYTGDDTTDTGNTTENVGTVTATSLYLRQGPSGDNDPVEAFPMMPRGTQVLLLERHGNWGKVRVVENGVEGYCSLDYVDF